MSYDLFIKYNWAYFFTGECKTPLVNAPLTNLFELFELLDRYQSEMIDFFRFIRKNHRKVGVYDKYN